MPGLAPYKRTLAVSQRTTINARGTTIFLRAAIGEITVTARSSQIGAGGGGGVAYTLRMNAAEKWFTAEEFDSIEIENGNLIANTIELYIGYGDFEKPVPDVISVVVTSPVNATADSTADTTVGQGQANKVLILPGNGFRLSGTLTALAANADTLRVGDIDVDVDQGTPLAPGETISWPSKAPCFVCSEGATAAQKIAIVEHLSQ